MHFLIDFILHIDKHLIYLVNVFGDWTYLILFLIIFVETGAVILPFLPGDSLLFAAAALSANPQYGLNIWIFVILFLIASILGDSLNFMIGRKVGMNITKNRFFGRFIKEKDLAKARSFFDKYGAVAIFIARFIPIVRTFAPFVAASSDYSYRKFIKYNLAACFAWVILCCGGGYFFGNIPFVQEHFSVVVLSIIGISLIPAVLGLLKERFSAKK
ncbi:VTT domain-containing protein [Fructilactobacillus myrtifloralis]|uniref:VTT domain-containing protein n=1 Tax=Fructilactobacillus myrtifloralis TaxID=2940301 RepID=A0ABY5BNF7_9LACO|nr:VTT domain-containing protein [Fructilactobacillus myrtifloralis]USS85213.1 VTT domain-containing protein [Fructilactobacillus myrtifloralis]